MRSFLKPAFIIMPVILAAAIIFMFAPAYGADREIKASADGYCGPINMLVTIDSDGKIKNIKILKHNETAGVGARICEPNFLKQFSGHTADEVMARKGVDAITGATISTSAVIETVGKAVKEYLSRHPSQLREEKKVRQ